MAVTTFSAQLQQLRKEKGIKQETLAQYLGVSPQAVSKWENGSYPEGDLLPKIADYFGVSIDYLYGRERREVSIEQRVLEHLQAMPLRAPYQQAGDNSEYFEQMMKLLWAMQIACYRSQSIYYDRNVVDDKKNEYTASQLDFNCGFTYMSLNKSLEYYMLVKEPEGGFAKRFSDLDKLTELFAFLGDKDNMKVLLFMLSLNWNESVRSKTIAKQLNLPEEKVEAALKYLLSFNWSFDKTAIIDESNNSESIYTTNLIRVDNMLMLLVAADGVLKTPLSYTMQCRNRNGDAWVKREDLEFLAHKKNPSASK